MKIMKNNLTRIVFYGILLVLFTGLLSGCFGSGAAGIVYNWPGLFVDAEQGKAYLSNSNFIYAIDLEDIRDFRDEKSGQTYSLATQLWTFPAQAQKELAFTAPTTPSVEGDLIAAGYNGAIYTIDPANGQQLGMAQVGTNRFYAAPLVLEDRLYAPNIDYNLYALNANGNPVWSNPFSTGQALWSKPASDGNTIYLAGMDHRLRAIDPDTGTVIWETEDLGGAISGSPTLSPDGKVYVGTFGDELIAFDKTTGKELGRTSVSGWIYSDLLLEDGVLYFGDLEGFFYAVDASTMKILWDRQPFDGKFREITSTPLIKNGRVYFANKSGTIFAYNAADGQQLWAKTPLKAKIFAPIQVYGETVLVTTDSKDALIALDQDGNTLWTFQPVAPK